MDDTNNASSRTPPSPTDTQQLSKDTQGSDKPISLLPEWLPTKADENKRGNVAADSGLGPYTGSPPCSGSLKSLADGGKPRDTEKKKDVFRPSVFDRVASRQDSWHDEERDTSYGPQKDQRREGDKTGRWIDNSKRNSGEPRHGSSERWTDSSNRGSTVDLRDNKWNTCSSPDERDKWPASNRVGEVPRDKELPPLISHEKADNNGDHGRPWRNKAYDSPNKGISSPSYERSHDGHTHPVLNCVRGDSRGKFMNSYSRHSSSIPVSKGEGDLGECSPLRYSRTEMLDVYSINGHASYEKSLDGLIDMPSLTQEESLKPLALSAPTAEELVVLKGMESGDIVDSCMLQAPKDGFVERNSTEGTQHDNYKCERSDNTKRVHHADGFEPNLMTFPSKNSFHINVSNIEVSGQRRPAVDPYTPWRSHSAEEQSEVPSHETGPRVSDLGWSQLEKDHYAKSEVTEGFSSDLNWSSTMKKQPCDVLERERNVKKFLPEPPEGLSLHYKDPQGTIRGPFAANDVIGWFEAGYFGMDLEVRPEGAPRDTPFVSLGDFIPQLRAKSRPPPGFGVTKQSEAAEDLSLYYKDPRGAIQGPFSGGDLIEWFETGFFGLDLEVRPEGASHDTPFLLLGDVIPQLRAKARLPPGFGGPKKRETTDVICKSNFKGPQKLHFGCSEADILQQELRNRQESQRLAENRTLESLISGNMSSSLLEKLMLCEGKLPTGLENGHNLKFLLAQKLLLERQRSLSSRNSSTDSVLGSYPQNMDLISILHGLTEKSSPGFSIPQQLPLQSPPIANTTEKLLSSVLSQDPIILKVLQEKQRQLLLEQEQKFLQQQQYQQQLIDQQQLLLQQLLSKQQEQTQIVPPSENLQVVTTPPETVPIDSVSLQAPHEMLKPPSEDLHIVSLKAPHEMFQTGSLLTQTSQDVPSNNIGLRAPHEMFQTNSHVSKDVSSSETSSAQYPHEFFQKTSMGSEGIEKLRVKNVSEKSKKHNQKKVVTKKSPKLKNCKSSGNHSTLPSDPNLGHHDHWESEEETHPLPPSWSNDSESLPRHNFTRDTQQEQLNVHSSLETTTEPLNRPPSWSDDSNFPRDTQQQQLQVQSSWGTYENRPIEPSNDWSDDSASFPKHKFTRDTQQEQLKVHSSRGTTPKKPLNGPPSWSDNSNIPRDTQQEQLKVHSSWGTYETRPTEPSNDWSDDSGSFPKHKFTRDTQQEQLKVHSSWGTTYENRPIEPSNDWSDDSGSFPKHNYQRDTQQEQELKVHSSWGTSDNTLTEDSFWGGPLDTSIHETMQSQFPSLGDSNWETKPTHSKGSLKKKAMELKEAKEFKLWCENESERLTGSKDTSLLEFCLKQSTSEAELLLKENLGVNDRNQEFIEKFINYKKFLSAEIVEIAFQAHEWGGDDDESVGVAAINGGKKKKKKGKKMSGSVLGIKVASNRFGEIQVDDD